MKKKLSFCVLILLGVLLLCTSSYAMENITNIEKKGENKRTIEDGIYVIKTALDENYVLDISEASKKDGANLQLWTNTNVIQQRYKVTYLNDGYYSIINMNSGKALDVSEGSKKPGANVWQWGNVGVDAQKWIIKDLGNGNYNIISKCNNLYLDVDSAMAKNGTNIQVFDGNGTNAQKFKFEKYEEGIVGSKTIEDGIYVIKTALNENYVLDISEASKKDGANVQLWSNANVIQQRYKVTYLNNGYYSIINMNSGKALDVSEGSKKPGANVWQWNSVGVDAQKWIIKDVGNGNYNIISKLGNYLNVKDGKATDGANIEVNKENGTNAQKFKFEEYEEKIQGTQTIKDGIYEIKTALDENHVLDVAEASNKDGANIQIWNNCKVSQQRFKVKYIGNGNYTISALHSKKVLDVAGASKKDGTNVQQWTENGTDAQKWIIKDLKNGEYNIISELSNLYLTVAKENAKSGSNIQVNKANGKKGQNFKFEEVKNNININEAKYPGYKERIEALKEKHPTWNFELLYTGLRFSDAVAGEYSVRKRNLVPTTYNGEWISGTELFDTGWYGASQKAIAHYMDPRNFLDDINVFQFQDVNEYIPETYTLEGIKLKVNKTFLQDYAVDIDNACKVKNVNPYYIIARLFQENGRNPKNGTHKMDGGDGKFYYNPFNIGASGDSKEEVYNNALARAKKEGWDTMQKALEGGITFCKANWLDNYQNTLYQNRFDIDTRNGTSLYTHQYMQNLMGAYSEAKILRESYVDTNKIESNFTFIIPIYEGMSKELSPIPVNNVETYAINVRTTGTNVRIRKDANTDSEVLREITDKGTVLLSIQRGINTNWQKVITEDGLIGYMSGDFLEQIDDITTCNYKARVKTNDGNGCNVRVGPSIRLEKITALADEIEVTVIDDSTYKNIDGYDWSRVILENKTQVFIPSMYLAK